jgi:putative lipoic acid-binding regulatory protein
MKKPHIDYPCKWTYKIFGSNEADIKAAVSDIMAESKYDLSLSNKSSGGKYVCLELNTDVTSEDMRNNIYISLSKSKAVIRVL